MSERQVLVLLRALVSLAHHIVKVNFLSWKVFGQYLSLCQQSGHRKGSQMLQLRTLFCSSMTGKNVTSVCVIQTSPDQKKSLLDPAKSLPGLSAGRSANLFPAVEAGFLRSRCGNKFPLEQVYQWKQLLVQLEPEREAASGGAGCRT